MKRYRKPLTALGVAAGALTLLLAAAEKPAETPAAPPAANAAAAVADPEKVLEVKPPTGALPAGFQPSESLREIVKMAQAGVSEDVLLTYIRGAGKAFHPSPEDIIFLNDLGVGEPVLKALIDSRDGATADTGAKPAATALPASVLLSSNTPVTSAPAINGAVAQPAADAPPAPAANTTTVVVTEPAPVTSVNYFYESLAPYGSWVNLAGYGWCWQPTVAVVNVGWRPYCDNGRWVYSNYGWYWHSGYSWGWAPFHYGRWHQHAHRGWLWQPDTVWGASWVSWRYSSQYCGWAPLPPAAHYRPGFGFSYYNGNISVGINFDFGLSYHHYNYVPVNRFCDPHPRHHVARHTDVQAIHNHTTVNNNYISGNNNTVINRGIDRERIARGGRTPVPEVTVRDALVRTGAPGATTRIERDGTRDVVYRPVLGRPSVTGVERDPRRGGGPSPTATASTAPATTKGGFNPPTRTTPAPSSGAPAPATVATPPAPASAAPATVNTRPQRPPTAGATASETLTRGDNRSDRVNQLIEEARRNAETRKNSSAPKNGPGAPLVSGTSPTRGVPPRPSAPAVVAQPAPSPAPAPAAPAATRITTPPANNNSPNGRVSNERVAEMIRDLQSRKQSGNTGNINARPAPTPAPAPVQRESVTIQRSQPTPPPTASQPTYSPAPIQRQLPQSAYRPSRELPSASAPDRSRGVLPGYTPRPQSPGPAASPAPSPSPAPSVRSSPAPAAPSGGGSVQSGGNSRSVESRGSVQRGGGNGNSRGRGGDDR